MQPREPVLRVSFDSGDYQVLPYDHTPVQEAIVPVVGWNGDELVCLGTAFAIDESGVFVTARHVVQDWVTEFQARTHQGSAGLYVLYESDRPVGHAAQGASATLGGPLAVGSVSWHPDADVAVFHAQTPYVGGERVPFPTLELTVAMPRRGDQCFAVGYARMHIEGAVRPRLGGDASLISVDYDRQLAATRGSVEQVHPDRRDNFRLTWPCFLTDARYDKGMSGSPVLSDDGRVIGVVCSSTPEVPDQPFTSYATLTAAILPIHLELAGDEPTTVVMVDLISRDIAGAGYPLQYSDHKM